MITVFTSNIMQTGTSIGGQMVFRSKNLLRFLHQNMLSTWWNGLNLNWMMNLSSHKRLVILFYISCPQCSARREEFLQRIFTLFCFLFVSNLFCGLFHFTGAPFPSNFRDVVKTIFKRLFRVYAHIYHSHFQKIVSLKEEAHLNTCFKHFILFTYVSVFSLFMDIILT